jgi:hypothetical protein
MLDGLMLICSRSIRLRQITTRPKRDGYAPVGLIIVRQARTFGKSSSFGSTSRVRPSSCRMHSTSESSYLTSNVDLERWTFSRSVQGSNRLSLRFGDIIKELTWVTGRRHAFGRFAQHLRHARCGKEPGRDSDASGGSNRITPASDSPSLASPRRHRGGR